MNKIILMEYFKMSQQFPFTDDFLVQAEHPPRALLHTSYHCGYRGQVPYVSCGPACRTTFPV